MGTVRKLTSWMRPCASAEAMSSARSTGDRRTRTVSTRVGMSFRNPGTCAASQLRTVAIRPRIGRIACNSNSSVSATRKIARLPSVSRRNGPPSTVRPWGPMARAGSLATRR